MVFYTRDCHIINQFSARLSSTDYSVHSFNIVPTFRLDLYCQPQTDQYCPPSLAIICDRIWEKVHYGAHNDFSV